MKSPNNIFEHVINLLTYGLTILGKKNETAIVEPNHEIQPIWITGMFRSGTSITTQIMNGLGYDLGPKEHLLQAKGKRGVLNPNGFFENYLMMDWSLHVFKKLNAWGDNPPSSNSVEEFIGYKYAFHDFAYDSLVNIHDDRISNWNKVSVLKKYSPLNLDSYFKTCFRNKFAIKNPHFLLLTPLLDFQFPNAKFIVVFRNPLDTVESAKKVTANASVNLYFEYYSRVVDKPNTLFFNYDNLIANPQKSIVNLAIELQCEENYDEVYKLVRTIKNSPNLSLEGLPENVKNVYSKMLERAVNRN